MNAVDLLLVDDAPEVRTIVAHLCKRDGVSHDSCQSVAAAWAYLQEKRPRFVLLDVRMPPVSGIELCRLVRSAPPPIQSLPLALFTHWGVPADVFAGLEAGVDFIVSKDVLSDPRQWQRRIKEILARLSGSPSDSLLRYAEQPSLPAAAGLAVLGQAVAREIMRRFGPEIGGLVVRRALRQSLGHDWAAGSDYLAGSWTQLIPADRLLPLAAALADVVACLVGQEGATPLRSALAPLLGSDAEPLTHP